MSNIRCTSYIYGRLEMAKYLVDILMGMLYVIQVDGLKLCVDIGS